MSTGRIIAIVIVALAVVGAVFASVMLAMTPSFGAGPPIQTPASSITKSSITDGIKFTFAPVSVDTEWSEIIILLSDGSNVVQWFPATTDLDDGVSSTAEYGDESLGLLTIYCNVTDTGGNGYINVGDYFKLTIGGGSFSSTTTYTCIIMYEPTESRICFISFTG
jgi:hypothetical protein